MGAAGDLALECVEAWRRDDFEWLVEHSWPDLVIRQPPELVDSNTYEGHAGIYQAFADWPRQWEEFDVVAADIAAESDDAAVLHTRQKLRGRDGLEFELDTYNLIAYEGGKARSWEMFLDLGQADARLRSLAAR